MKLSKLLKKTLFLSLTVHTPNDSTPETACYIASNVHLVCKKQNKANQQQQQELAANPCCQMYGNANHQG
jgi:hypothetical protein